MSVKLIIGTLVSIAVLFLVQCEAIRHFNGYSVIRLIPETESQLNYLRQLENNVLEVSFD